MKNKLLETSIASCQSNFMSVKSYRKKKYTTELKFCIFLKNSLFSNEFLLNSSKVLVHEREEHLKTCWFIITDSIGSMESSCANTYNSTWHQVSS